MEDKIIIKMLIKKKECGLSMLIEKYGGFIKAIIRRRIYGDFEDECIDDVLMCIWDNIKSYDSGKNEFKNWVAAITRYKIIDYNRKHIRNLEKFKTGYNLEHIKDKEEIDLNILERELKMEVESLLNNLSKRDKEIFIKYYLEEKEMKEIEREMGVDKSFIYNRLSRGRGKLRSILGSSNIF